MEPKPNNALFVLLLLLFPAGCGRSEPLPLELLGSAKMAVQQAERTDHSGRFAPAELRSAQQKVAAAEVAVDKRDATNARRLAEQAIVDAQLVKSKTLTALAKAGAYEQQDALRDVQHEIAQGK